MQGDTITYVQSYSKYLLFLSDLMKLEFSRQIFEKYSKNFMKIRPVAAEFHADRQAGMTKLTVVFRAFTTAPKICNKNSQSVRYLTHNTVSFP